jgi:hypothetical protein
MDMIEDFIAKAISEYGAFVACLLLIIAGLLKALRTLWDKLESLTAKLEEQGSKFLKTVENNTKVLTRLLEKLGADDET